MRFRLIQTTSAPVSVDFGNDHLYVAGATTVDSFVLHENSVGSLDGTTDLALAVEGAPQAGSSAQVGLPDDHQLLVADAGVLGVIDRGAGQSHLSAFRYNRFGELALSGAVITIGVPDANGVAILSSRTDDRG